MPVSAEDVGSSGELVRPRRKASAAGVAILVILLLLAVGLVGASAALKNTVDPRPLLEDLLRSAMKQ